MPIIGCDYHPSVPEIAFGDTGAGELSERRLGRREQGEQFYRELKQQNPTVRVGPDEVLKSAVVTLLTLRKEEIR